MSGVSAPVAAEVDEAPAVAAAVPAETAAVGASEDSLAHFGSVFSGWYSAAQSVVEQAATSAQTAAQAAVEQAAAASAAAQEAAADAAKNAGVRMRTAGDGKVAAESADGTEGDRALGGGEDSALGRKWVEDAGKLWETAVRDVGERLEAAKLNERVDALREQSTLFIGEVSKDLEGLDGEKLRKRAQELEAQAKVLMKTASEQLQTKTKEAMDIFQDADAKHATTETAGAAAAGASGAAVLAPWDEEALPEAERKHADALRLQMLKLVVDSIYSKKTRTSMFLSGTAAKAGFEYDADANPGAAMAVLDADENVRRLRSGLVPQKIGEALFWNEYFYHVQRVRVALIANDGVMPPLEACADVDDDDAALFASDDDDEEEEIAALHSPVRPPRRQGSKSAAEDAAVAEALGPPAKADKDATFEEDLDAGASGDESRDWENEIDAMFGEEDGKS